MDDVLAAVKLRLDERTAATVDDGTQATPDVVRASWELVRRILGVIGNSLLRDEARGQMARETLDGMDGQPREVGIDLDEGVTGYADRLASPRDEAGGSGPRHRG